MKTGSGQKCTQLQCISPNYWLVLRLPSVSEEERLWVLRRVSAESRRNKIEV
jgi:hypothetical protein